MMKSLKSKVSSLKQIGVILYCLLLPTLSFSQQPTTIKKSENIETIDGKKFFIHTVEKGQTLYSIAKTYSTTVDIVLANNSEAVDGLKIGGKLKIPYNGNTTAIEKKIEKKEASAPVIASEKKINPISSTDSEKSISATPTNTTTTVNDVRPIGDIHVALFLPLSLSMVKDIDVGRVAKGEEKFSEEIKTGIEFYEGVKMAFDSLKKQGFVGSLHVYDINLDSAGFAKLMKKPEIKDMDLFIGPLYGKRFEAVLKFAKENNINIVSPTIQGNNILMGNPNVSKVTPSYATQSEELAKYISEKHAGQNIIVFNSANPKDKPYVNTFKKTANLLLQKSGSDTVKEVTFATLHTFISKTKPNIIAIPSTNQSFITEAVNNLYLHKQENIKDSLIVFGMSNWQTMESLDFGYLKALYASVSSYSFVDYSEAQTKKFILRYREEYKTDPTEHVFSGFDVGYYYLGGLQKYGNALQQKLPEVKHKGIQTEFNFVQADPPSSIGAGSGYENKGVGIMKLENFLYVRVE